MTNRPGRRQRFNQIKSIEIFAWKLVGGKYVKGSPWFVGLNAFLLLARSSLCHSRREGGKPGRLNRRLKSISSFFLSINRFPFAFHLEKISFSFSSIFNLLTPNSHIFHTSSSIKKVFKIFAFSFIKITRSGNSRIFHPKLWGCSLSALWVSGRKIRFSTMQSFNQLTSCVCCW